MRFYKEAFKLLRESRGFTLEELAKQLGITKSAISHWENINRVEQPHPKRIYQLSKILGCSVVDISDLHPEDGEKEIVTDRLLQFVLEEWGNLSATAKGEIVAVVERDKKDRNETGNYTQKQA